MDPFGPVLDPVEGASPAVTQGDLTTNRPPRVPVWRGPAPVSRAQKTLPPDLFEDEPDEAAPAPTDRGARPSVSIDTFADDRDAADLAVGREVLEAAPFGPAPRPLPTPVIVPTAARGPADVAIYLVAFLAGLVIGTAALAPFAPPISAPTPPSATATASR